MDKDQEGQRETEMQEIKESQSRAPTTDKYAKRQISRRIQKATLRCMREKKKTPPKKQYAVLPTAETSHAPNVSF